MTEKTSPTSEFDLELFELKLESEWAGRNFIYLEEVDSTNNYLLDANTKNLPNGTVALAEKQLNGRGRFNRNWYSSRGQNLTFSLLLNHPKILEIPLYLINLTISLTVAKSIDSVCLINTDLKWPNDVLVNKKKISGILIETQFSGEKLKKIVAGIGINVNQSQFMGDFHFPPTSVILELGLPMEREKLLAEFLNFLEESIDLMLSSPGTILSDWRKKCKMINEKIEVKTENKTFIGIMEDISDEGELLLNTGERVIRISNGDVTISL